MTESTNRLTIFRVNESKNLPNNVVDYIISNQNTKVVLDTNKTYTNIPEEKKIIDPEILNSVVNDNLLNKIHTRTNKIYTECVICDQYLQSQTNDDTQPADFDAEYYMKTYPDVASGGFDTPELAKKHYKLHGIKEGRKPRSSDPSQTFDAQFYMTHYPDVVAGGFNTPKLAHRHWLAYGKKEGRLCSRPTHTQEVTRRTKGTNRPSIKPPNDFCWAIYERRYPDLWVNGYQKPGQLYWHWKHYGEKQGRRHTEDPHYRTPRYDVIKKKYIQYIKDNPDCKVSKNNREICIALNATNNEIKTGKLRYFIQCYNKYTTGTKYKPDFYIFLDYPPSKNTQLIINDNLRDLKNIKQPKIISCDISIEDNVYLTPDDIDNRMRPHGRSSGPNMLFYRTMKYFDTILAKHYNRLLLLEWDTQPTKDGWLDELVSKYSTAGNFLIYGSQYKGKSPTHPRWRPHLNGVGIYNISNPFFATVMNESEKLLIDEIVNKKIRGPGVVGTVNYDIAIFYYIDTHNIFSPGYVNSNEFVNYSLSTDSHVSIHDIVNKEHPGAIIVHKKPNEMND